MPRNIASHLDLELAFSRVLHDLSSGQSFFRHPHESDLINQDKAAWLSALNAELPTYVPGDLYLCNAPKGRGAVRPGAILSLRDQTIYAALVGALSEQIRLALDWQGEYVDFSYPISTDPNDPKWFQNYFPVWRRFAEQSISRINNSASHVVLADITAYYETIDIGLLLSDLRAIGAAPAVLELLSKCLNKWSLATVPARSLPQGFSASNILARFYLNQLDRALRERGVHHLRYVDDIRLFCRSEAEAKRHFVELILLLRKRGLAVQSAKSEIVSAHEATQRIEGLLPALRSILQDFVNSVEELFDIAEPYFTLSDAEQLLNSNAENAPIGLIREAYRKFFMADVSRGFNKTLFHFLIRRLAHASDDFAFNHALTLLENQPQETKEVLKYIARLHQAGRSDESILDYLASGNAVYPYQHYLLVAWRMDQTPNPPERFVSYVRELLFGHNCSPYLRAACREFLARFGSSGDLERMQESLQITSEDFERAELLCCLRRLEVSRRNSLLARYSGAGPYTDRAIALVRNG